MSIIEVIGGTGADWSAEARAALLRAEVIAGCERLLAAVPAAAKGERVPLTGQLRTQLPELLARCGERPLAVLGSGDPLCCGIGGTLARLAPEATLHVHPAPTAFQRLFARLGVPWEKLTLFSLHGVETPLPWRRILQAELPVLYGDARRPARALAAELCARFPAAAERPAAAGCDLDLPGEVVRRGRLGELAALPELERSLSVLVLLPGAATQPELALGRPDGEYLHFRNMITHPEVRAVALAKLRLKPGVLWDLGAGSGSVGLEAAELCPGLRVHAVERRAERLAELRENVLRSGVAVTVHGGESRALLPELPDPDRVFLGGGGRELPELLRESFARLRPGGVLVATAVLTESAATLARELREVRSELLLLNLSRAAELGRETYWRAENPITLGVWRKAEEC